MLTFLNEQIRQFTHQHMTQEIVGTWNGSGFTHISTGPILQASFAIPYRIVAQLSRYVSP